MEINTGTKVLGLLGNPLGHSLSPLMHNAVFLSMGLNCVYLPFQVPQDHLAVAVAGIRALNLTGVNVTIPFKEAVIPYLDELSPTAEDCGAVNVIKNDNGRLIGHNTDGTGFIAALREEAVTIEGSRVLFIGAGGAARSLAMVLGQERVSHIDFLDTDYERARSLSEIVGEKGHSTVFAALMNEVSFREISAGADIIVNCSPVGMYPHVDRSPVLDLEMLDTRTVLCDIIYNPIKTRFLEMGQAKGLKIINGLGMFVNQGAFTLDILLGIDSDREYMKSILKQQLGKGSW
ncbi:MAG: shikimate dehydrogenase [Deltaproteobacteria bacterium]